MNPEQPSREQIEARITALLLGELPAAEAELLRWTISRDAELQKLRDQLKLTIGFVREAMKNPAGAPMERDTPVKLPQERRQTLLAHFKTARPQPQPEPPQKLSWLKRIEIPSRHSLVAAAIIILVICGLAAISIPNFVKARSTSQENACINNLRQIDAAKNEWALETHKPADAVPTANDLTPYLQGNEIRSVAGEHYTLGKVSEPTVADFNGKRLTAEPENLAFAGEDLPAINKTRQEPTVVTEYNLEARRASRSPSSTGVIPQEPKLAPTPAPIALPNTESSQTGSEQVAGGAVYEDNTVGYINVTPGASSAGYSSKPRQEEPKTEPLPGFAFSSSQSEANTASPFANRLQSQLATSQAAPGAEMPSPPPSSTVPSGIDGQTGLPIAQSAPVPQPSLSEVPQARGGVPNWLGDIGATAAKSENSSDVPLLMPPRLQQQYGQRNGMQPPSAAPPQVAEQITPIPPASTDIASSSPSALSPEPERREQEQMYLPPSPPMSAAPAQVQAQTGSSVPESPGVSAIQPAPGAGPYVYIAPPDSSMNFATNFNELSARQPSTTGITSFGGGGVGGVAGRGAVRGMNDQPAWSWAANDMNMQAQSKSLLDNKKVVNGTIENGIFQNGMQNGQVYANTALNPNVTGFNFPDQSSVGNFTNSIAMGGDRNLRLADGSRDQSVQSFQLHNADPNELAAELRKTFAASNRGIDKSALATRESQNAQTVSDSATPTPALAPPRQGQIQEPRTVHEARVDVANLQAQYQQEEGEIQQMQSDVDQLRKKDAIRDTDPNAPTPTLSSEQVQTLNEKLVEQKALCIKLEREVGEFQAIQTNDATKLADVLVTISPDNQISDLLDKLHENEQRLVTETNYLAPANPDVVATKGLIETERQEISDRVAGIMYGYQAQLTAAEVQVAGFTNQLNDLVAESQDGLNRGQDYWIAKAKLQNKEDLHRMLGEKIEADEADASMPKSALVAVINPATPAQSQTLWQRMTGTFESKAQIEIQPDISSAGTPIEYAPYAPYFTETEVKSIQSDVVLGRVVDALKLDQAWSEQGNGEDLSRKGAIARLRSQLDLQSDRNTKLIDIGVKSDKPAEAAKIANAVAEAYREYRLEVHSNEMAVGIERLQQQYAKEDGEIRELRTKAQQMETPPALAYRGDILRRPQVNAPIPQPEIQTLDNAFSTFSLNVSDVSFKLAMASLQKGQMPDPASIRSEEFINAFDYHDPEPLQGEPLAFVSERAADPFAQERDLLRFSIKAAAAGRQDGRALNLVLLLDTSGSMERSDRVAIIREALRVLSSQLQPQDVVSVVTFARTARLWADGVPGDQAGATLDKVGSITPEGGTNLEEAMRLAYETALRHFIAGGMNRVVMLTDGAANLGNVDPQTLTQKVDWERRQGIALDCFGIGWDDYNDDLLEQLSSNGDGRYAFINSPDEAATEFAAKLAGALQVAAEDVKVQVEFNPSRVTAWRQIGYAKHQLTKQQFRDNSVAAGAIAAREAGNALYVIQTNPDGEGPIATVRVRYRVPGTQDVQERSWLVDYSGAAHELAQSSPAMRLAATAAGISEWMANSPFAQDVTPDELLNYLSGVPQFYATDERPKQLEWMIREAKSVSGK